MVGSDQLDDMIDMIDQHGQRRAFERAHGFSIKLPLRPHQADRVVEVYGGERGELGFGRQHRLIGGIVIFLIDKHREKIDLDDAAIFCQRNNHFIAHVAGVAVQCAHRRVRGDHRRPGGFHDVRERRVGDMADIDHHADAVHFFDH